MPGNPRTTRPAVRAISRNCRRVIWAELRHVRRSSSTPSSPSNARHPASLEVCALLTKPERRKVELPIRYEGFAIPNKFAIGYGLDHAERYRNLPYVAALAMEEQ